MLDTSLDTAVLLMVFNRPEATSKVFERIRLARPRKLYIAVDGPRIGNKLDVTLCNEVKIITSKVDWPCEVHRLIRSKNLGCTSAVTEAISWFFDSEHEGIILEDDVLPMPSFFRYCSELLKKYRYDDDIFVISGCNLVSAHYRSEYSYFFSNYNHIWGWASWRRAWKHYDCKMKDWAEFVSRGGMRNIRKNDPLFALYWNSVFYTNTTGQKASWDYIWAFSVWKHNGLSIRPSINLVDNIGFGKGATRTVSKTPQFIIDSPASDITFPLKHPPKKAVDKLADKLTDKYVFNISLKSVIAAKIVSVSAIGKTICFLKSFLR